MQFRQGVLGEEAVHYQILVGHSAGGPSPSDVTAVEGHDAAHRLAQAEEVLLPHRPKLVVQDVQVL
jgi:hypothetical protein